MFSRFFIDRPIFAAVISIVITVPVGFGTFDGAAAGPGCCDVGARGPGGHGHRYQFLADGG